MKAFTALANRALSVARKLYRYFRPIEETPLAVIEHMAARKLRSGSIKRGPKRRFVAPNHDPHLLRYLDYILEYRKFKVLRNMARGIVRNKVRQRVDVRILAGF